jgi:aminoglycoside phosphotransferase (APT) family kinase protein
MNNKKLIINEALVRNLITTQFPQWKDLFIRPVETSGWDNKTFRLGEHMLIRMPSAIEYAAQVKKEHLWLPKLAPLLPLTIPVPLALGQPTNDYPCSWSIYKWLEGESANSVEIANLPDFAFNLAQFLIALEKIDTTNGPLPGPDNFYRGSTLMTYDSDTRKAIKILKNKINSDTATKIWNDAITTAWHNPPVWIHGDISPGNLLVQNGKLISVIDFGMLAIGDPACDLAIAWTMFAGESRKTFRAILPLDPATWARGRAWALWKALIIVAGLAETNTTETTQAWRILDEILANE